MQNNIRVLPHCTIILNITRYQHFVLVINPFYLSIIFGNETQYPMRNNNVSQ